jgi:DNA-binding transcriptional ArsR family regulator
VAELQQAVGASQQNVSKHLGIMRAANMIDGRKHGNRTVYAIRDPVVFELCDLVRGGVRRQVDELRRVLDG